MADDLWRPRVWPIAGELFRMHVESASRPEYPHLVDLESYKWNGQCDDECPRFKFKCAPHLSRGSLPADGLRCSHIKAGRSFFLDDILPRIAASIRNIAKPQTLFMETEGMISAIATSPVPAADRLRDLMELRDHLQKTIDQIE